MLTRWDPWRELSELQRQMSNLTRTFFGDVGWPSARAQQAPMVPAVDVFSRGDDLVVRAELPGVDPDRDIDVSIQEGMLVIRGERRREERQEGETYYRVESSIGAFERAIPLPETVKESDIKASYDRGVLEVVVPKAGQLGAARRIPVTSGGRKAVTASGRKALGRGRRKES